MVGVKQKLGYGILSLINKIFDEKHVVLHGAVDIYKNNKHIEHIDKVITNQGLKHIPLCIVGHAVNTAPPSSNGQFSLTWGGTYNSCETLSSKRTYNLLRGHNLGNGTSPPQPTDIDLESPLPNMFRTTNNYVYFADLPNRKCAVSSVVNYSFTDGYTITEYGVYLYKEYGSGNYILFDRATFPPINVVDGDVLTFKYTLQIIV